MAVIDPICIIHKKRMSEHVCLFCCLCYKPLTGTTCNVRPDGCKEDVCVPCAEAELKKLAERNELTEECPVCGAPVESYRYKCRDCEQEYCNECGCEVEEGPLCLACEDNLEDDWSEVDEEPEDWF